jgi:hypothetical protein
MAEELEKQSRSFKISSRRTAWGGIRNGAGRPRGSPNKLTASIKETIKGAFEELGGQAWLVEVAKNDPRCMIGLLAKMLPAEQRLGNGKSLEELLTETWNIQEAKRDREEVHALLAEVKRPVLNVITGVPRDEATTKTPVAVPRAPDSLPATPKAVPEPVQKTPEAPVFPGQGANPKIVMPGDYQVYPTMSITDYDPMSGF